MTETNIICKLKQLSHSHSEHTSVWRARQKETFQMDQSLFLCNVLQAHTCDTYLNPRPRPVVQVVVSWPSDGTGYPGVDLEGVQSTSGQQMKTYLIGPAL